MENRKIDTLIILAGGQGSRMKNEKPFMILDGKPLIAHVIHNLSGVFQNIIISAKMPGPYAVLGLPVILDDPDAPPGPLRGIYSAMKQIYPSGALIAASDMPFIKPELAKLVADSLSGHDAAVPRNSKGLEPLLAAYGPKSLKSMEKMANSGKRRISELFESLNCRYIEEEEWKKVDPEGKSFINVNTPDDLLRLEEEFNAEDF